MQKIDANIILRYVLDDHEELSPKAREIIDQHVVEVPVEVLCEAVYVLTGHYKIERHSVVAGLKHFFEQTQCALPNREAVLKGLDYFGQNSLDFVDCLLAGYAEVDKDEIFTFDDKLEKLLAKITGSERFFTNSNLV
jgi:predicted nucleic-acid-binding protein